ncbi:SDR family oxidoreductase [Amycolatopsis sp. NPDC004368]
MKYVVHGATGAQGAPVVAALTAAGHSVVALTRHADAVVDNARVAAVDNSSSAQLAGVYRDADGVFVHLPLGPEDLRQSQAENIVSALRKVRPKRIVFSTSGTIVDAPGSVLQAPDDSAVMKVISGLRESALSHAVIAARLFLENLLLPPVVAGVKEDGVLRYPLRAEFGASWVSHLDMADVAAALLTASDVTGVVAVGQYPPLTGPDLAEAFAGHFGRPVSYEAIAPSAFGEAIAPVIGEYAASGVAGLYELFDTLPANAIPPERSARELLGIAPRATGQWLADIGL